MEGQSTCLDQHEMMEQLYDRYWNDVFKYVYVHVYHEQLAEDLTQETFVRAFENGFVRGEEVYVKAWLLKIARNLCIDHWRKAEQRYTTVEYDERFFQLTDVAEREPLHCIEHKELCSYLQDVYANLKGEYKQVLYLCDMEKLSYKQAAEIMGISLQAFTSLLNRARITFAKMLLDAFSPEMKKGMFSSKEYKTLLHWFDLLDWPKDTKAMVTNKNKHFFNGFQDYDQLRNQAYPQQLDDFLVDKLTEIPCTAVGDFGCGSGILAEKLANRGYVVYAVDHSIQMVNLLKNRIVEKGIINIHPLLEDVYHMSRQEEYLDVGYSILLLHHVFDPGQALFEMTKRIKPGGRLIIADFLHTSQNWRFKESHDLWSGFKPVQLEKWLKKAGLHPLELKVDDEMSFSLWPVSGKGDPIKVPLLFADCIKK